MEEPKIIYEDSKKKMVRVRCKAKKGSKEVRMNVDGVLFKIYEYEQNYVVDSRSVDLFKDNSKIEYVGVYDGDELVECKPIVPEAKVKEEPKKVEKKKEIKEVEKKEEPKGLVEKMKEKIVKKRVEEKKE